MTPPEIPPIPEKLLRQLSEPAVFWETCDFSAVPGTVWEVVKPDGELVLLLIVESIESEGAGTFAFVRAVPLTDLVQPTSIDSAIVATRPKEMFLTAHCWLEGPVSADLFVRCVGDVTPESMNEVERARNCVSFAPVNHWGKVLRQSLYEQFDPLFVSTWEKLYSLFEKPNPEAGADIDEVNIDEVKRVQSISRPSVWQASPDDLHPVLAAGDAEAAYVIIDRLASASVQDVPEINYRKAWAYFLASTFRGTASRDEWLKVFLSLSSVENELAQDWMKRVAKAKQLMEQRDWRRYYQGEKVYELEDDLRNESPASSSQLSAFTELLADFAELDPAG